MGPWAHVGPWARAPGPGALGPLSPQVAPPDPDPGKLGTKCLEATNEATKYLGATNEVYCCIRNSLNAETPLYHQCSV